VMMMFITGKFRAKVDAGALNGKNDDRGQY
jgi:hypothetical protein